MDPLKADECLFYILLFLSLCYKKNCINRFRYFVNIEGILQLPAWNPKKTKVMAAGLSRKVRYLKSYVDIIVPAAGVPVWRPGGRGGRVPGGLRRAAVGGLGPARHAGGGHLQGAVLRREQQARGLHQAQAIRRLDSWDHQGVWLLHHVTRCTL